MTTFALERFEDCWEEVINNAEKHWYETEQHRHGQKFNPNIDAYIHNERLGLYFQFTARDSGKLIGHCGMYITPSMHTQQVIATEDSWFLLPEYRKSGIGVRMYKFVEKFLKGKGVVEVMMHAKLGNNSGQIMEKLGYTKVAYQYSKHLVQTAPAIDSDKTEK